MTSIAELGISINSGDAVQAADNLDKLTAAGERSEAATERVGESAEEAAARIRAMVSASIDASDYAKQLAQGMQAAAGSMAAASQQSVDWARYQQEINARGQQLLATQDRLDAQTRKTAQASDVQADGLQALLGRINPVVAALDKLDEQQMQLQKYRNAGLLDTETFSEYNNRIEASRKKLGEFNSDLKAAGVSANQTEQALRQLPSQFTDIFTSLAGGQNPFLVLIQQGGQIKDSFGGLDNMLDVLREKLKSFFTGGAGASQLGAVLGSAADQASNMADATDEASESLTDLADNANTAAEAAENAKNAASAIGPSLTGSSAGFLAVVVGVAAVVAAIGTLVYGYNEGSQEADEYNKSLILTGNYAGSTADALGAMARRVSDVNGTTGQAADALAQLAASGKIAEGSFEQIANAAVAMEDATGRAVSETIAEFVKIADGPTKAIKALDDQYHFLTSSVYSQIVALEQQGRHQDAVTLATDTYEQVVRERSDKIVQNLGWIEKAWKGITDESARALDTINNVGRSDPLEAQIDAVQKRLAYAQSVVNATPYDTDAQEKLKNSKMELQFLTAQLETQSSIAKAQGLAAKQEQASVSAMEKVDALTRSSWSNEQKRNEAIKEYRRNLEAIRKVNPDDARLDQATIDRNITNINSRFKDPKAPRAAGVKEDAGIERAATIGRINAGLREQLATTVKLTAGEQEMAKFNQEIADLKGRSILTVQQKQVLAAEDQIRAELSTRIELEKQVKAREEAIKLTSYQSTLNSQLSQAKDGLDQNLAGLGLGDAAKQRMQEMLRLQQDYAQQQRRLQSQLNQGQISADLYKQENVALDAALKERLRMQEDYYAAVDEAQSDWSIGAQAAFGNYLEEARNIARQTQTLFTNAFTSMEDAIVSFATTGKLSFSDFAKSILADMARIAARQASSQVLSAIVGAVGSYFGGGASAASTASSAGSTAAGYSSTYFPQALGGAWGSGVQLFADGGAFTNSIVDTPTAFGMAGGKTGVMGEAGPEAIMPLARTSDGSLGVRAIGGSSGGGNVYNFPVSVSVSTQGDSADSSSSVTAEQTGKTIQAATKAEVDTAINNGLKPGGRIWLAINGRG